MLDLAMHRSETTNFVIRGLRHHIDCEAYLHEFRNDMVCRDHNMDHSPGAEWPSAWVAALICSLVLCTRTCKARPSDRTIIVSAHVTSAHLDRTACLQ